MVKEEIRLEDFLASVSPVNLGFVNDLHELMLDNGCTYKIETAKNGYVVSYILAKTKKVIANYVFRKSGLVIRVYGDNINAYENVLDALPVNMSKAIEKAPACKRLLDPAKCNSRCKMGYTFSLNGTLHKKCRYNSFMFKVTEENYDAISGFLRHELDIRNQSA